MSNTTTTTAPRVTRKGSGRTKGSFSFVKISLADIKARFKDDTTPVLVSRKWAEAVGFTGLVANPAVNSYDAIQGVTPATAIQAVVVDLDSQS
jgi:hypothetical protein